MKLTAAQQLAAARNKLIFNRALWLITNGHPEFRTDALAWLADDPRWIKADAAMLHPPFHSTPRSSPPSRFTPNNNSHP